jgi:hypothetical protein
VLLTIIAQWLVTLPRATCNPTPGCNHASTGWFVLTTNRHLLDQVAAPVVSFTADGAYDQEGVAAAVTERHPEAAVIVPPRSTAVPSETAATAPTQRDRHLQVIAEHGRAAWQKASGYTTRARVEATMGRFKQVIGDGLRSRTDQRRATEVDVAVHALNRMLELGRPISVRIA